MRPIKTNETNFTYLGPSSEIADLPCRTEAMDTFSVWELSAEERALIAQGGHLRLGIYGMRPIPPVSLQVVADDGPYKSINAPCDICGKLVSDDAHGSGPGTHAYRHRRQAHEDQLKAVAQSKLSEQDKANVTELLTLIAMRATQMKPKQLRRARELAGLSIGQAAHLLEVSTAELLKAEDGEASLELLSRMDEVYGLGGHS